MKKKVIVSYKKANKKEGSIAEFLLKTNGISQTGIGRRSMKAYSNNHRTIKNRFTINSEWESLFHREPIFQEALL